MAHICQCLGGTVHSQHYYLLWRLSWKKVDTSARYHSSVHSPRHLTLTKHSFGAPELGLYIETGQCGPVWRPSSILSRYHLEYDTVNSIRNVRKYVITSNIELTNLLIREIVETPSLARPCIMNSLMDLLVSLQKVNFFLHYQAFWMAPREVLGKGREGLV